MGSFQFKGQGWPCGYLGTFVTRSAIGPCLAPHVPCAIQSSVLLGLSTQQEQEGRLTFHMTFCKNWVFVVVSQKKFVLPATSVTCLGVEINTVSGKIAIPLAI